MLDTQPAEALPLREDIDSLLMMWLVGTTVFLGLLLILVVSICLSQRARYQRQLKAATVTAFGNLSSFKVFTSNNVMALTDDPSYSNSQRGIQHTLQRLEKLYITRQKNLYLLMNAIDSEPFKASLWGGIFKAPSVSPCFSI